MKKTVTATITKEFEIEIPDEHLTPESIAEFEQSFWSVTNIDELFGYAALQIAQYDEHFVEGFGQAKGEYSKAERVITFKENSVDTEYEVA